MNLYTDDRFAENKISNNLVEIWAIQLSHRFYEGLNFKFLFNRPRDLRGQNVHKDHNKMDPTCSVLTRKITKNSQTEKCFDSFRPRSAGIFNPILCCLCNKP